MKNELPARELNYLALLCGVPDETRSSWLRQLREGKNLWNERSAY